MSENFPEPTKVVDLGAGPCVFARHLDAMGHHVTAVDARTVRVPDDLGSISFVHADVREFDVSPFDLVLFVGLFHHFEIEDQLAMIRKCAGKPVILDTEVHIPAMVTSPQPAEWQATVVQEQGYEGVVFPELDNPMASVRNPRSFWHTPESILRLFEQAGVGTTHVVDPLFVSKYGARRFYFLTP